MRKILKNIKNDAIKNSNFYIKDYRNTPLPKLTREKNEETNFS